MIAGTGPTPIVRDGLVVAREFGLNFAGSKETYWLFDDFLRKAVLIYLSEAGPISLEIPDTNRPS